MPTHASTPPSNSPPASGPTHAADDDAVQALRARSQRLEQAAASLPPHSNGAGALAILDELWPEAAQPKVERLAWLLPRWPQRAIEELSAALADRTDSPVSPDIRRELETCAASAVLALGDAEVDALAAVPGLPDEFREQARLVRAASATLAAGHDEGALTALRQLPAGSRFERARQLLFGLAAYYGHRDEDCAYLFGSLQDDPVLGHAATQLLVATLGPELDADDSQGGAPWRRAHDPRLDGAALELLGCGEWLALGHVSRLLREGRGNAAVRAATLYLEAAAEPWREALLRALGAALSGAGLRPRAVALRLGRALERVFDRPLAVRARRWGAAHLSALLSDDGGRAQVYRQTWSRALALLESGTAPGFANAEEQGGAIAEILAGEAERLLHQELLEGAPSDDAIPTSADANPRADAAKTGGAATAGAQALALLARAAELSARLPGADLTLWRRLLALCDLQGDAAARLRALEGMQAARATHPQVVREAIRDAARRARWQRALALVLALREQQPGARDLGDLELHVRLGAATARWHRGEVEAARRECERALGVRGARSDALLAAHAAAAALRVATGDGAGGRELLTDAIARDARPWLAGWFYQVARRLRWRPAALGEQADDADDELPIPDALFDAPPTRGELAGILQDAERLERSAEGRVDEGQGVRAHELAFDDPESPLGMLLDCALACGYEQLERAADLHAALSFAATPELMLSLAERGRGLFPGDPLFVIAYYAAALQSELPVDAFADAERELGAVLERFGFRDDTLAQRLALLSELFSEDDVHPVLSCVDLRARVRAYLRAAEAGPGAQPSEANEPGASRARAEPL
ncbi:hypothetical protein [Haliangium ochraceum]|uniref:Uncharacterized protein n=1 Tax=Haliangium ochraceum (strain DSM 14365 / JCM 11303 / SMP-2) TaxID=502025 RepID=D0LXA0_HALO1|nr:hypothetical protein [Haliangium ochraceum]ACY16142.1 conserved hypothetical protein [Haliangium ochraceum DSM 14365]